MTDDLGRPMHTARGTGRDSGVPGGLPSGDGGTQGQGATGGAREAADGDWLRATLVERNIYRLNTCPVTYQTRIQFDDRHEKRRFSTFDEARAYLRAARAKRRPRPAPAADMQTILGMTDDERRKCLPLTAADDPLYPLGRMANRELGRGLKLRELAELYGVSREYIRQVEARALAKIRRHPEGARMLDYLGAA